MKAPRIEPFEVEPYSTHLQYRSGFLYWLSSPPGQERKLIGHDLSSGDQTTLLQGELKDVAIGASMLVALDGDRVLAKPLDGGSERVLAMEQGDASRIAMDATHAYWLIGDTRHVRIGDTHPGSIRRVAVTGGEVEKLIRDTMAGRFALADEHLVATHRGLSLIRKSDNEVRDISSVEGLPEPLGPPTSLRILGDYVYVSYNNASYRISLTERRAEMLYDADIVLDTLPLDDNRAIVVRNTSYAMKAVAQTGAIVLVEDGKATVLAECERPLSVAIAPDMVYYIDTPLAEGQPPTLSSVPIPRPAPGR